MASLNRTVRSTRAGCKVCNNLDPRGHPSSIYHDRVKGIKEKSKAISKAERVTLTLSLDSWLLKRSGSGKSKDSCRWCEVLCEALDGFFPQWRSESNSLIITCEVGMRRPARLVVSRRQRDAERTKEVAEQVVEIYRTLSGSAPWPTLGAVNVISLSAGSERCIAQVKKWIETCDTSDAHSKCQGIMNAERPARLLRLLKSGHGLKLCTNPPRGARYIALSHCWGSCQPLTTVKSNLQSHIKDIPRHSLPTLFQDAIHVCRSLDVEFIWIDSLCIIQDDRRDWSHESSKMGSIYRGAYLVIAATMAKNSQDGFLVSRKRPMTFEYKNSKGDRFNLKARMVLDHHPKAATNSPCRIQGPLMERAWVLQERTLGRRVLHFTETELVFECASGFACECHPQIQNLPTSPALLAHGSNSKYANFSTIWKALVQTYTTCNLTQTSDKLPAISGIARELAELDPIIKKFSTTSSQYLAGLWRPYILDHLLWSTAPWLAHPHTSTPVSRDRAPSFSWASVDSQIHFTHSPPGVSNESKKRRSSSMREGDSFVARFISGTWKPNDASQNLFGPECSSGSITIRGPVLRGYLIAPEGSEYNFLQKFKASCGISADVEPDCLLLGERINDEKYKWTRRARPGDDNTYHGFKAEVICLAIAFHESHEMLSGLVLSPSKPGEWADSFERIGHFTSATWPSSEQEVREITIG